jgi:hypothetical protein
VKEPMMNLMILTARSPPKISEIREYNKEHITSWQKYEII